MVLGHLHVRLEFDRFWLEHEQIVEVCDDPRIRGVPEPFPEITD
jgi:hypothetical protein